MTEFEPPLNQWTAREVARSIVNRLYEQVECLDVKTRQSLNDSADDLVTDMLEQWSVRYDRSVLVEILVYHYRKDITGCGCGWAELGKSWPDHIANVYEECVLAREADDG